MEDTLIQLLESFEYPVFRQGSLADDEAYPQTFLTFWEVESVEESHYDNSVYSESEEYEIYIYSSNPETTYTLQRQARDLLRANGWIITRREFDAYSDEETHTGRGFGAQYLKEVS